jgi:hypothetical protein
MVMPSHCNQTILQHYFHASFACGSTGVVLADRGAGKACCQLEQFDSGFFFHGAAPVVICGLGNPQFNAGMPRRQTDEAGL